METGGSGASAAQEAIGIGAKAELPVERTGGQMSIWSCDRRYWHRQVGHYAARFTVVTVDLAGHGESGTGRQSYTMPAFGADVAAVVTGLDLPEVVLVGHSMGGDVVVEAARLLGVAGTRLVWADVYSSLEDSGPDPADDAADEAADDAAIAAFMAPFRADFAAATRAFVRRIAGADTDPDLVDRIADDMAAAPPHIALDAMRHSVGNERAAIAGLRHAAVPAVAINPARSPPPMSTRCPATASRRRCSRTSVTS